MSDRTVRKRPPVDLAAFRALESSQTVGMKLLTAQANAPDEYEKSVTQIHIISPDGCQYMGAMQRCGVSAPGYPDRATYVKVDGSSGFPTGTIYVYDGGYFWNSTAWHTFYREHRKTPAEAEKENEGQPCSAK
jgi:hypothetical protein